MTLKTEILSNFNNTIDSRVSKFLEKTISALDNQKIEVTDYTKMILTLLVAQLVLYYKASDDVLDISGVTSEDAYKRKSKMPEIAIMQKSHDQILNLLDKISLSPLSAAKIKKLNKNDSTSAQDLLNSLMA